MKSLVERVATRYQTKTASMSDGPAGQVLEDKWNDLHDLERALEDAAHEWDGVLVYRDGPGTREAKVVLDQIKEAVKLIQKLADGGGALDDIVKAEAAFINKHGKPYKYIQRVHLDMLNDARSASERVAGHFVRRHAGARWDGKFVGKDCRLQWSRGQWLLEELPQKGKRKLRVATMQNVFYIVHNDRLMPENILQDAKLSRSDAYDGIKKKIEKAMQEAATAAVEDGNTPNWVKGPEGNTKWYENDVYFLEVIPENVDPFEVEGKDFTINVSWTAFKTYSPDSDLQQSDPHYTYIKQKSPGAARKLYNTLKTDPTALKNIPWSKLTAWLDTKKIGYDMQFSQWT